MGNLQFSHGLNIVITTTFVSLLAMPIVGPVLPVVQEKFAIYPRLWVCSDISLLSIQLVEPALSGLQRFRLAGKYMDLCSAVLLCKCWGGDEGILRPLRCTINQHTVAPLDGKRALVLGSEIPASYQIQCKERIMV